MKKNTKRQARARLQSITTAELAKVSGGALWNPDLLIMGGCFPTEPVPQPFPYPLPSPYPIPTW